MHPAQIQAALAMAGYSQAGLARELGLAPTTVSAVIKGRGHSAQVEQRIAEITGHSLAELWPQWHGNEKPLVLNDDERALIELLREQPAAQRNRLMPALRALIASSGVGPGAQVGIASDHSFASGGDMKVNLPPKKR